MNAPEAQVRELRWRNLRLLVEGIGFGALEKVVIQHGMPVLIETATRTIKLDQRQEVEHALKLSRA